MDPGRPCHELAGVIVESKTDAYHEGQRVIAIPTRGMGGLMEYMKSDPTRMVLLPDEGPLDEWVMCQPSGTVLFSCSKMGSVLQKNVLIFGQGSIGLSFSMLTSKMGARSVTVVDPLDYRLEKSRTDFGATLLTVVVEVAAAVVEVAETGADGGDRGAVEVGEDQPLVGAAGAGEVGAVGVGDAALADEIEVAFRANAVGIGDEELVLRRPRRDQKLGHVIARRHLGGRHGDQFGPGQRQSPRRLDELDVVADQDADLEVADRDDGGKTVAGGEVNLNDLSNRREPFTGLNLASCPLDYDFVQ